MFSSAKRNYRTSPGKIVRSKVFSKFNGLCGYCGMKQATVIDHIQPCISGGKSNEENLMPSCASCNNYKHSWSLEEFRLNISLQIERSRKTSLGFRLCERFGLIEVINRPIIFHFEKSK